MNYLTNYYKNLSEQLQAKINHLQYLVELQAPQTPPPTPLQQPWGPPATRDDWWRRPENEDGDEDYTPPDPNRPEEAEDEDATPVAPPSRTRTPITRPTMPAPQEYRDEGEDYERWLRQKPIFDPDNDGIPGPFPGSTPEPNPGETDQEFQRRYREWIRLRDLWFRWRDTTLKSWENREPARFRQR